MNLSEPESKMMIQQSAFIFVCFRKQKRKLPSRWTGDIRKRWKFRMHGENRIRYENIPANSILISRIYTLTFHNIQHPPCAPCSISWASDSQMHRELGRILV